MINPQMYAVEIEHILSTVFSCERFGVGGLVNSDYIRTYPFHSMMYALTYIYATATKDKRDEIENFFQYNFFYAGWSIDTIISFENAEKEIDGIHYSLDHSNGMAAIESLIQQFDSICK